ncbi:universal stress protein UspA [Streptomyces lunaelactis]|uniref:Universal stress protein UspA n=1 Tax=Streptomyces lunaelactis TaxID=1535768 RepID=A0A2R4T9D8_9ACTN|nr:universal stress protein [Streptomyces lunaelactis]AVZ75750.1 universal stress protein UspA [Streptomyces lunaelactis]NUK89133.1 universal stress protein [Streptomyces lunaelactis]NUL06930.1 universal stress protein [Streptomyces lunaelactis]
MTVLVGYVPSPEGEAALRAGVDEARTRGETLLVMNTSRGDAYVDRGFAQQKDLDHVRRDLTELGVDFDIRQVVGGRDAAEEILDLAASSEVSLVVIGLRHRSAVGKLLMGSSAQRILLDSPCPVLAVKADS